MNYEHESVELLTLCLKHIPRLNKHNIVDAGFIWTEPHSMRLIVKLKFKQDVNGVTIQQKKEVNFQIQWRQCSDCNREFTNQTWKAVVQVRQRVDHKRTFFYLEQLILKANAQKKTIDIQVVKDGMDFFFAERTYAHQFAEWLSGVVPQKLSKSRKLISMDNHSNVSSDQMTLRCDIVPLCRGDLVVCTGIKGSGAGLAGSLALVHRVTSVVQLLDPSTLRMVDLTADKVWKSPMTPIVTASALTEFVVLDVELLDHHHGSTTVALTGAAARFKLAEIEVAKASDMGVVDTTFRVQSHLGGMLQAGDTVLGYDLRSVNCNDIDISHLKGDLPDVVLVKKGHTAKEGGKKGKRMKLQSLHQGEAQEAKSGSRKGQPKDERNMDSGAEEYEQFIDELESDETLRQELGLLDINDDTEKSEHDIDVCVEYKGGKADQTRDAEVVTRLDKEALQKVLEESDLHEEGYTMVEKESELA